MLIERFDRVAVGEGKFSRRHMVSALTMLAVHESEMRTSSYADIAKVLSDYGAVGFVATDKIELFRRMVFNILVTNDDDHLRNHAFLWSAKDKGWRLSDLYDVLPKPVAASERFQAINVGGQGRLATLCNALSSAGQFGIRRQDAIDIIHGIAAIVREWRTHFDAFGVSATEADAVSTAFRNPRDIGLEALT